MLSLANVSIIMSKISKVKLLKNYNVLYDRNQVTCISSSIKILIIKRMSLIFAKCSQIQSCVKAIIQPHIGLSTTFD